MASFINNSLLILSAIIIIFPLQALSLGNHKGISFQAVIKLPNQNYPTVSGITVNGRILTPNNCIIREEEFTGANIANGYLNLTIGGGATGGYDPGFTMAQVMDNSSIKTSLTCLNADGSVNNGVTSFDPSLTNGARKFRISFVIDSFPIVADFNMRSMAYAINAESLDGKLISDFINVNDSKNLTQTNIESIFTRYVKLDAILNNFDNSGSATSNLGLAASATTDATNATNITSGTLSVDRLPSTVTNALWSESAGSVYRNGNVGIGTATPSSLLEVAGTGKFTGNVSVTSGTASSSTTTGALVVTGGVGVSGYMYADRLQAAAGIQAMASVGTIYSPSSVTKNWPYSGANLGTTYTTFNSGPADNTGAFFKMNVRNTAGNNQLAYIGSVSTTGAPSYSPAVVFGQQTDVTSYNERMRIDSIGNVGIGTTAPAYKLDVQGGDINASGSVRAAGVALTSDIRFKRDIASIESPLEKILNLRGVTYQWKLDEFPEKHFSKRRQLGVIAQEVEKQFPEAVDTDRKGFKSVNYPAH